MTALIIGAALALVSLAAIAYPLIRKSTAASDARDSLLDLQNRRQTIYREIGLLQEDLALGNVSQADYEHELQRLRLQAATILRQQQHLQEITQALEAEILQARRNDEP